MANTIGLTMETRLDITIPPLPSPEPDSQRGRKRRREFSFEVGAGRAPIPSGESGTCRGRCRYRSSSRYIEVPSLSRPSSQHRMRATDLAYEPSAPPSPSRLKVVRMQLTRERPRSQSPSRSRSPHAGYAGLKTVQYFAKRRRQRTQSRSRAKTSVPVGFEMTSHGDEVKITAVETLVLPLPTYGTEVPSEVSGADHGNEQG
ncbi:hypothetical protein F4808DRAFT_115161 [Astrocystis sublimbata]|nr:hypothetical protein F4808DRAFT_115161 [Astrocystis sublimbata]